MNMKKYIKPLTKEIKVNSYNSLLAGSGGVETGSSLGNEYSEGDVSYSKESSGFDDSYDADEEE